MTTTAQERNAQAARQARVGQGARAEQTAAAFLRGRGLRLLARNYRAPGGEIDLIAEETGTLVFVEVRLRSGTRHGGALESIDRPKRRRIVLAARHYLAQRRGAEPPCRFDVVLLMPVRTGRAGCVTSESRDRDQGNTVNETHPMGGLNSREEGYAIEWLRDAFSADDC